MNVDCAHHRSLFPENIIKIPVKNCNKHIIKDSGYMFEYLVICLYCQDVNMVEHATALAIIDLNNIY